jgi:hypothetical protein
MPGLTAGLTLALLAKELLRLGARLRPTLPPGLRRIGRRRLRTRPRVPPACPSSAMIRSSNRAICASYPEVSSSKNSTHASRPASQTASASARSTPPRFAAHRHEPCYGDRQLNAYGLLVERGECADALGRSAECLWDDVLPVEVKELPEDLAALDGWLSDHELLWPLVKCRRKLGSSSFVESSRRVRGHCRGLL